MHVFPPPPVKAHQDLVIGDASTLICALEKSLEVQLSDMHAKLHADIELQGETLLCRFLAATRTEPQSPSGMSWKTTTSNEPPSPKTKVKAKKGKNGRRGSTTSVSSAGSNGENSRHSARSSPDDFVADKEDLVSLKPNPSMKVFASTTHGCFGDMAMQPVMVNRDMTTTMSEDLPAQIKSGELVVAADWSTKAPPSIEIEPRDLKDAADVEAPGGRVSLVTEVETHEFESEAEAGETKPKRVESKLFRESSSSVVPTPSKRSSITSEVPIPKNFLHWLVINPNFESFVSSCIFINCVTIGLQSHAIVSAGFPGELKNVLDLLEHIFTAIFTLECCLRFKVFGLVAYDWHDPDGRMNIGDAMLVFFTGILFTWVIPLVSWALGLEVEADNLQIFSVFRALRLSRLLRVFRKQPLFREAWMLIRGLKDSMRTLFWTIWVIFLVTYVFAIFGLVAIVGDVQRQYPTMTPEQQSLVSEELMPKLAGLDRFMFTMIQVMLQDSFHGLVRDLIQFVPWCWIFFYAYTGVACFVLMNLVTAIIVENALANAAHDQDHAVQEREMAHSRELKQLKKLFISMDADESGTLNWEEFQDSFMDPHMSKKWYLLDFHPRECKELFELLDDGDGEIETDEFFEGLGKMKGSAQSKDVFRIMKAMNKMSARLDELYVTSGGVLQTGSYND